MEFLVMGLFCALLLVCVILKISVIYALIAGLFLFSIYTLRKGYTLKELWPMLISGVKTTKNILIILVLIGMLTALWRACGTIPMIICYAAKLIQPSSFVLIAFLLNCLVSVLIGSALGTAATMGVISMSIANSMGVNQLLAAGAILSGIYFGDRCSPVSSCASLVAELTQTDIFTNIKIMVKRAFVPFMVTAVLYLLLGMSSAGEGTLPLLDAIFGRVFVLHWVELLPAAAIIILSLFKVKVKMTMLVSIIISLPIALFIQHIPAIELPRLLLLGYSTANAEIAAMLSGGGIRSMLKVLAIMIISSSYAGIFKTTGLLDSLKDALSRLSRHITAYGGVMVTGIITAVLACNQTLAVILTNQLCSDIPRDKQELAMSMADTVVVIAPLVPWSTAGGMPLASIGAPASSLLLAFFLYLLPIWGLLRAIWQNRREKKHNAQI